MGSAAAAARTAAGIPVLIGTAGADARITGAALTGERTAGGARFGSVTIAGAAGLLLTTFVTGSPSQSSMDLQLVQHR